MVTSKLPQNAIRTPKKFNKPKGNPHWDGNGLRRGSVRCATCRGGDERREKCSLEGATPICGCWY